MSELAEEFQEPLPGRRARAREAAFQLLFQEDFNRPLMRSEAEAFLLAQLREGELMLFAGSLVDGVRRYRREIDREINRHAEHWSVDRMAATDRNVLRLAAYELLYTDTPGEVVIDQAVELAKRYGTSQSGAFVNGILDKLLRDRWGAFESEDVPRRADRPGGSPLKPPTSSGNP